MEHLNTRSVNLMKIWILDSDVDKYENLMWKEDFNLDEVQSFDGRKKTKDWNPIKVKRMYDREFSNTPGFSSHIPVFDATATNVLRDLLEGDAEILPLDCVEGDFFAINVTRVLDCIDYEKSSYKTFRDGKRIMRFINYVFKPDEVETHQIFKIPDERLRRPFVSDEFRNRVIECGLTGFVFKLAWDSEQE